MFDLSVLFNLNLIVKDDIINFTINQKRIQKPFLKCFLYSSLGFLNSYIKQPAAYVILNTSDGAFYIGSSGNVYARILQHRYGLNKNNHESSKLQKSVNESDKHLIHISIIFTKDIDESRDIEQYLLDTYYSDPCCVNLHPNARSSVGMKHSYETKVKISKIVSGRQVSDTTRMKLSLINKGKKMSDIQREKLSIAAKNRIVDYTRLKRMSEGNIGRIHNDETLYKKSIATPNRKPVKIDNVEYQSISWAAKILKLPITTVYKRINSKSEKFNNYTFL